MTADDQMRDQLAAALTDTDSQTYWSWRKGYLDVDQTVDTLLSTVRKIVATELREMATITANGDDRWQLRDRAAVLDAKEPA